MVWPLLGFCWWLSGKEFQLPIQEMWVDLCDGKTPLGKEMPTHSSILAWEISWTEELGWLWSSSFPSLTEAIVHGVAKVSDTT